MTDIEIEQLDLALSRIRRCYVDAGDKSPTAVLCCNGGTEPELNAIEEAARKYLKMMKEAAVEIPVERAA